MLSSFKKREILVGFNEDARPLVQGFWELQPMVRAGKRVHPFSLPDRIDSTSLKTFSFVTEPLVRK